MKTIDSTLFLVILILFISCSPEESENPAVFDQTAKSITRFRLPDIKLNAEINTDDYSIHVAVPARASITNISPTIDISQGASISPASFEEVDLSQPVIYTVTAYDGSTRKYTVTGERLTDTALVIIDMQYSAFDNPNFVIPNTVEICQSIETVANKVRTANKHVLYAQATSESVPEGSSGWQVVSMLSPEEEDIIVLKHESNTFENSELQNELSTIGVGVVIMCGVATDMCIKNTFIGANARKYDIIMLADGHSTKDPGAQETINTYNLNWASQGAAVLSSEEINF